MQDFFLNPVVSGVSDTGSFKGSSKGKEKLVVDLGVVHRHQTHKPHPTPKRLYNFRRSGF